MAHEPKSKPKKIAAKGEADVRERLRRLGLFGLEASYEKIRSERWLPEMLETEEAERRRRSLERRMRNARIGRFRPMADFDWKWPKKIDRELIEEVLRLDFFGDGANVILVGGNGVGKTMIAQNIAHQAVVSGRSVRMVTASELLCDLGSKDTTPALTRAVRRYTRPHLLVVDEVGYLAGTTQHADLLFEVVNRRYQEEKPIVVTTNKPFKEWNQVFPSAGSVVTLVDRLVHRSEIIRIDADSYRNHEAQERERRRHRGRTSKSTTGEATAETPGSSE